MSDLIRQEVSDDLVGLKRNQIPEKKYCTPIHKDDIAEILSQNEEEHQKTLKRDGFGDI